jgi:hypothetical protein
MACVQKQIMSPAIPMYYSAPTIIDSNIFFVAGDDRHTEDGANVLNCTFIAVPTSEGPKGKSVWQAASSADCQLRQRVTDHRAGYSMQFSRFSCHLLHRSTYLISNLTYCRIPSIPPRRSSMLGIQRARECRGTARALMKTSRQLAI